MLKKGNKIICLFMLFLISLFILPYLSAFAVSADSVYVWSPFDSSSVASTSVEQELNGNFLNLTSASAILMDQLTGTILYEHNSHEKLRPASVTNVMDTSLLIN